MTDPKRSNATAASGIKKNLFEIENARNLTRDQLVNTFVVTTAFLRLLSTKNHIVLGSRGSGKTALAKMLSHDHLSRLHDERAAHIIKTRSLVGIYVPTRLEWVGGLKNKPWQTDGEADELFQWRLNLSTCAAFLRTLRSCLAAYVPNEGLRARKEREIVGLIATAWSGGAAKLRSLLELKQYLEDIEYAQQQQMAYKRIYGKVDDKPVGLSFHADLFTPLRRAITLTERALDFPADCTWMLCLDEAEFLEKRHHRIVNSHLRSYSGNLVFKITTMPYFHHTLETNTGVPLDVGHDFEYVYIDQDPVNVSGARLDDSQVFATSLFRKRAKESGSKFSGLNLRELLGPSDLLDRSNHTWVDDPRSMELLRVHATDLTVQRAEKLLPSPSEFMDQIGRKISGALQLRAAVIGRDELDVYSGETMAIRCGDGNPRRLIRLFNSFLLSMDLRKIPMWDKRKPPLISKKEQTRLLLQFSTISLTRVQSEPSLGPDLYALLSAIGDYMNQELHRKKLTTDQIYSVETDEEISDKLWSLIKWAVGLGLLYPNVSASNPDHMPERIGTFHLAYVLAPHFRLLPRRGRSRKLSVILHGYSGRRAEWARNLQGGLFE